MSEDEYRHAGVRLEHLLSRLHIAFLGIEVWRYSVVGEEAKPREGSFEVALNDRRGNAEQHQEYGIDRDHDLKDVVDDSKPAHERIVKQNIVVEDADYPEQLARDRHHRYSGEKQKWQQHPAQHRAHLPVEVVGQNPVGYLHRAD